MILFLTSDIGASQKINEVRVATKLNNENKFVDNLIPYIKEKENFVFIASSPDSYQITDIYANVTFEAFKLSGIEFEKLIIVDNRTKDNIENIIKNADIVFLAGGNTHVQNKFLSELKLGELLKKYSPTIIGQSAGALNLAKEVYCSPEGENELNSPRYFKGLGLTDINIEPHFSHSPHFAEQDILQKERLKDSKTKPFIAITDGSYIIDDGINQTIYGEAYLFYNGKFVNICKNKNKECINSKYLSSNMEII